MHDLVSIIVPCYNKERYVAEAIQSAIDQTYPRCEIIVIDDGSTDGSLDIIRGFGDKIRWKSGPNRGGSAARNSGLELANGDWIQFLDADDTLGPSKVEAQIAELITSPNDSIANCPWQFFTHEKGMEVILPRSFWKSYDMGIDLLLDTWLYGGYFPCHSWLVPKKLIRRVGGWNAALTGDDDGEFFGRILVHASNIRFVPGVAVYYRLPQADGVSRSKSREAAVSFFQAWQWISKEIEAKHKGIKARRAILRRLRYVGYSILRDYPELVDLAAASEKRLWLADISPSLPFVSRWLIGCFGIKYGLKVSSLMRIKNK